MVLLVLTLVGRLSRRVHFAALAGESVAVDRRLLALRDSVHDGERRAGGRRPRWSTFIYSSAGAWNKKAFEIAFINKMFPAVGRTHRARTAHSPNRTLPALLSPVSSKDYCQRCSSSPWPILPVH